MPETNPYQTPISNGLGDKESDKGLTWPSLRLVFPLIVAWIVSVTIWCIAFIQGMNNGPLYEICEYLFFPSWILLGLTHLVIFGVAIRQRNWVGLLFFVLSLLVYLAFTSGMPIW